MTAETAPLASTPTRRDQAIEHAADLLREGGPRALTSVAVARRMGLSQSAVYRHVRDMEELSLLAADRVITELHASLQHLVLDPAIDWERIDDVGRLCRAVVDQMVVHARAFHVVDQWRFAGGALGEGITRVLEGGQAMIEQLLELRWRVEFGFEGELGADEQAMVRAHARALQDDAQGIARMVRSSTRTLDLDEMSLVFGYRLLGGWAAFVFDMNERVGLSLPTIDVHDGMPTDASSEQRATA